MFNLNKAVYSFIPVGVALVAGGIQTAAIVATFTAAQWHIAAILIACVWLTVSMDAAAFHHSVLNGATKGQKAALWVSAFFLVMVLAIDMVILISPSAFVTENEIVRNLHYAPGVNLAISAFCLLAWIFFDSAHEDERAARQDEAGLIREKRLEYLESDEARAMYADMVRADHIGRVAARRGRLGSAVQPQTKVIEQPQQNTRSVDVPPMTPEELLAWRAMQSVGAAPKNGGAHTPPQ